MISLVPLLWTLGRAHVSSWNSFHSNRRMEHDLEEHLQFLRLTVRLLGHTEDNAFSVLRMTNSASNLGLEVSTAREIDSLDARGR